MQLIAFSTLDELSEHAEAWDRLAAGVPFRSWAWMSTWWRHFGESGCGESRRRLFVLGAFDATGRMVGVAPWYLERSRTQGGVIRWLGSGEVCSDYLSLMADPAREDRVVEVFADFLIQGGARWGGDERPDWDLLEIQGVDAEDHAVGQLIRLLAERGCIAHAASPVNCWRIELPSKWEDYMARLSKGHRKQVRRFERNLLDAGRAVLHTAHHRGQLGRVMDSLIELHQGRRQSLGKRSCFDSEKFTAFHREVMPLMLAQGQLELHWLEVDGRVVAAEYNLTGQGITYAYQSGINANAFGSGPGRLIMVAMLRRAIEQGGRSMDFLRGDEPYKAHFRATRRPCFSLRIVPDRAAARLRNNLWLAGRGVKRWMNSETAQPLTTPIINP